MKIKDEILVNQYGQSLVEIEEMKNIFNSFNSEEKKIFLNDLLFLILQSKPKEDDIEPSIENSKLKKTYTSCIIMAKGVEKHNLLKILNLPESEINKSFVLFLSLFKIAYKRRFEIEKNNVHKWWYWDLSDDVTIENVLKLYGNVPN
jgi:hypothetical protein